MVDATFLRGSPGPRRNSEVETFGGGGSRAPTENVNTIPAWLTHAVPVTEPRPANKRQTGASATVAELKAAFVKRSHPGAKGNILKELLAKEGLQETSAGEVITTASTFDYTKDPGYLNRTVTQFDPNNTLGLREFIDNKKASPEGFTGLAFEVKWPINIARNFARPLQPLVRLVTHSPSKQADTEGLRRHACQIIITPDEQVLMVDWGSSNFFQSVAGRKVPVNRYSYNKYTDEAKENLIAIMRETMLSENVIMMGNINLPVLLKQAAKIDRLMISHPRAYDCKGDLGPTISMEDDLNHMGEFGDDDKEYAVGSNTGEALEQGGNCRYYMKLLMRAYYQELSASAGTAKKKSDSYDENLQRLFIGMTNHVVYFSGDKIHISPESHENVDEMVVAAAKLGNRILNVVEFVSPVVKPVVKLGNSFMGVLSAVKDKIVAGGNEPPENG